MSFKAVHRICWPAAARKCRINSTRQSGFWREWHGRAARFSGWTKVRQYGAWSELYVELCVGAGDWRALWIGGAEQSPWSRVLRDGREHLSHVVVLREC